MVLIVAAWLLLGTTVLSLLLVVASSDNKLAGQAATLHAHASYPGANSLTKSHANCFCSDLRPILRPAVEIQSDLDSAG